MRPLRSLLAAALIGTFLTPASASGAAILRATAPRIGLSRTSGPVGAQVTVTGSGFRRSSSVAIRFRLGGGAVLTVATTRSSPHGRIHASFAVPQEPEGTYGVLGVGPGATRSNVVGFTLVPRLSIAPAQTAPFDTVCVQLRIQPSSAYTVAYRLTGYPAAAQVQIVLTSSGANPVYARTVTTDAHGSASGTYVQPRVPSGPYIVRTAIAGTTQRPAVAIGSAWYTCYAYSGRARPMRWRADGVGFLPGTTVTVRWTGTSHNPVFTTTVRANGSWGVAPFSTPCAPHPGTYTVTTAGVDGMGHPIFVVRRNHLATPCG
jgi:hypothetical protein